LRVGVALLECAKPNTGANLHELEAQSRSADLSGYQKRYLS
jgi:hypothetical protein